MNYLDLYILFYLIIFLAIFLLDYFLMLKPKLKMLSGSKKTKKGKNVSIMEIEYLSMKFKLDKNKLLVKWVLLWIAFANAIIITVVSCVVSFVPAHIVVQFLIGFVILMGLIYSLYELLGRYFIKKGLK